MHYFEPPRNSVEKSDREVGFHHYSDQYGYVATGGVHRHGGGGQPNKRSRWVARSDMARIAASLKRRGRGAGRATPTAASLTRRSRWAGRATWSQQGAVAT